MLTTLATLAGLALAQQTDTTVPVRAGARLEVNNFGGEIAVKTWSKSAVRIAASHSSRDRITIDASDQVVRVKSESRRGPSQVVDYEITVPAAMALALSGVYTDISVEGSQGEITAETVQGTVNVSGGVGTVSLKSVQGDVTAETVNGDISLVQIESANTEATTVNGDVTYDGIIKDGGRYRFSTHDGDLRVSIPEKSSVSVSVSTFNGDFSACFPVQLTGKTKHRFSFTIGSGSARLELESFNGDIRLCRPGQLGKDKDWRVKDKDWDKDHDNDHEEE